MDRRSLADLARSLWLLGLGIVIGLASAAYGLAWGAVFAALFAVVWVAVAYLA